MLAVTKEEREQQYLLKEELKSKLKSDILTYGKKLPSDLSKSDLIRVMIAKPTPSEKTKKEIETLLSSPVDEHYKKKVEHYLSSYLWWKDRELESKLLSVVGSTKSLPVEVKKSVANKIPSKTNGITYAQLLVEIKNPLFINKVVTSIKSLNSYKYEKYNELYKQNFKLYQSLKGRAEKLKNDGHSQETIAEILPIYKYLAGMLINLEELVSLIHSRKITTAMVRDGLVSALTDPEHGVASLVGRDDIKNIIASQIYSLSHGGFIFTNHFNNIRIYGGPGVGKTTLAKILGHVFSKIGVIVKGDVRCVTAVDFIGSYIGQTAPKTVSLLMDSLESVLFIDEAYQLTPATEHRSYSSEAITEIVNFTDKYIGLGIVIVAGYEKEMGVFMKSNDGLLRRFPYLYNLKPYTNEELVNILTIKLKKSLPTTIKIDDPTKQFLLKVIVLLGDRLKNQAGDMLNLASSISRSICSAYIVKWINGNLKNNTTILLEGVDNFLSSLDGIPIDRFELGI